MGFIYKNSNLDLYNGWRLKFLKPLEVNSYADKLDK